MRWLTSEWTVAALIVCAIVVAAVTIGWIAQHITVGGVPLMDAA